MVYKEVHYCKLCKKRYVIAKGGKYYEKYYCPECQKKVQEGWKKEQEEKEKKEAKKNS